MATNDNIYKITDINVTAAVIGKPLTMNGTALFANTDGYYGPYAYKATQENAGKKRFKEVVFDPQTFEDITIWHPTSPSDGISGTIQVDPDDNTKYVYKTNKDYALNLALFLIGNQRGDGFTFAVEDNEGVLVEYTLHRDQNNNPKIDKKVDPEEILEEVRSEVIAIATENSLKLNAVIDAVSSNIADGGIKLPMSKLTDEHGQPIDLNSRFILSTDSSNFVLESQATNFIVTDQFKNLLATNLGVASTTGSIGDEFFRTQLNDNPQFVNIITSNINDQLERNTNLNVTIENVLNSNQNLVKTNDLKGLATTHDLLDYTPRDMIMDGNFIKDSVVSGNFVKTETLSSYASINMLGDYAAKTSLFTGDKLKDDLFSSNIAKTSNLSAFVASTDLFTGDKLKDNLFSNNIAKTSNLSAFVASTDLFTGDKLKDNLFSTNIAKATNLADFVARTNLFTGEGGRIGEGLIDTGLMRSSAFSSKLAEGLGLTSYSTNTSIGNQFFAKEINDNPEFGDVISDSISAALTTNQDFERYVGNAVASNQNIVMRTELSAYAQTNTLFEGGKIKDSMLSGNVAMASNLSGLAATTDLTAYAQTSTLFGSGDKIKDSLLSDNIAKSSNLSDFVVASNLFEGNKIKDSVLSGNVAMASNLTNFVVSDTLSDYTQKSEILSGGKFKTELLGEEVLTITNTNYFNGGVLKSDKLSLPGNVVKTDSALLSDLVYSTSTVLKDIVYKNNTNFVADTVSSDLIATKLPSDVLKTSNTNYFANGVLKSDKLSLPSGVVMNTDTVLKNIVYNTNTSFVTSAIDSNVISSNLPNNVVKTDSALLSNLVYSTSNVLKNIVYTNNTNFVADAVSSDLTSTKLPDNVVKLGSDVLNNIVYTSNTSFVSSNLPNNIVRNTDAVLSNIVYTSNTSFVSSNLPNNIVRNTDAVLSNIVYTSNTSFVSSNIPGDVLSTNNSNYFSGGRLVEAKMPANTLTTNNTNYFSGGRLIEAKMPANVLTTNNTNFFSGGKLLDSKLPANALTTNNSNYFVNGEFSAAKMPSSVAMTSNIATEVVNNAPLIANEIANMDYNEFDEFITNEPIDNSLTNLLNIVKDVEIPEIALRSIMSDYSGYAYCTITTTTNESTRLTSWNNVSDEVKRNVVLAVDEINSGGSGDLSAQVDNYVYLLPNNTLKSEMITDEYIPCDDPVGHEIDIYTKNANGTYTKYTGTVQANTPYFYKASDAIFVVFECYWVKKDGEDRTCYKLPFNHTITVGTQYLDGTKYKKLGTVAEATSHMSDPTYVSVTRHYLNDGDSAHKGNVNVSGTTYYYYLTVDSTSEPMFSGMSKTYLSQYSNVYKLKMVQEFFDSNDNKIDLLTADISGDGYADLNEEICELHDRATGNEVVDIYSPYNVEYYYVVQRDYNAAVPNATALSLIESTIAHYEAQEPGTNYVYLFCYQDAPSMVQYNGNNIDCYALYFRAYARINDKVTALNWKPAIPYSINSKQFVYPAIIDLTPYGETNAISTNKNFNTKYPIYFNDFVQVGNTYTNTDNLFIEDGLAMKKVSSWQSGKDHFRKVTGERTTTMTGDEKVDYFLYHKKTLVTPVPDKIIPESLSYNIKIEGNVEKNNFNLKMTNTSDLKSLDTESYIGYDTVRARVMSLAYTISQLADRQITIPRISTSGATLKLYELLSSASVLGKYRLNGDETDLVLICGDPNDTNRNIVFYEISVVTDTNYYVGRDTIGYTIINDIFAPLGLVKDITQDGTYRNLYTFRLADGIKGLTKVFEWAGMNFSTPVDGGKPTDFYNAIYYAYNMLITKNNIDTLVEYYGGYCYDSANLAKLGLPLLDYMSNLKTLIKDEIGGSQISEDFNTLICMPIEDAFGGTAPSLATLKDYYAGEFKENLEWLNDSINQSYFAGTTKLADYKTKYEPQVNIPQDPIISSDKQTREFGLISGTTTKGFYAPNSSYYAGETYAPYTRPSEPSDWATGEYYTKSGNTYTRYTGTWDSATTYYYKIPRHIKNIFDRNTIVRFLVDQKSLAGGTKQRSTIEVRKWNRFTKDWSDMGIEQSMHTTVSTNADVPSYPVPGHEIEGVNDRTFEQYSSVIDELRTEVDGNSTLIANKINQLVNVVNGLVFANLASSTGQSFAEFSTEYTNSLVTPFNYSPTEGVIFDGTASDIPTPPQYVRHIDTSGAAPATNNVVATNENLEIEQTRAQTGWETRVPQGRTLNL